ncbi:MAG: YcbK family protein [Rhizobiaceae bacterium]|nr:YcbK family protein [Rhizobiaceae bacterium]MCV0408672.1 YcbK family protein [Rhizobiaceae bacterium]
MLGSPSFNQMGPTAALMAEVAAAESAGVTFGTADAGSADTGGTEALAATPAEDNEAQTATAEAAYAAELPETVASAPTARPGTEPGLEGDGDDAPAQAADAAQSQPEQPRPEQPQKKSFFASIFGTNANAAQTPAAGDGTAQTRRSAPPAPRTDGGIEAAEAAAAKEPSIEVAATPTAKPQDVAPAAESAEASEARMGDPAASGERSVNGDEEAPEQTAAVEEPKKKGFLAAFFGNQPQAPATQAVQRQTNAAAAPQSPAAAKPIIKAEPEAKPLVQLASAEPPARRSPNLASLGNDDGALPGVRQSALFEISRKTGMDDDSDVDIYEGEYHGQIQVASAAGLARLAPNGLLKQRESVDVACLKPSLVRVLKTVERRFGKRLVVTSGYRSPSYNRKVRGARRSMHMFCAAADVQIPGVSKWELAEFVRSLPGRGGVGTYCHTESVHIDVGPERDWNWRCRRRRG